MSKFKLPSLPSIFTQNQAQLRQFDKDLTQVLMAMADNLDSILDGGISLSDNLDCDEVSFTSNAVANTEDAVAHGLGKVPAYFFVGSIDKGGVVYKGATAFTNTHVYLKTTVASAAVKLLLV